MQKVVDDGNGLDERQLHDPPDEYLNAHQGVAHPCHDTRDSHDDERNPRVEHVAARHVGVVVLVGNQLPDGAHQQQGREQQIDDRAGQEHDAEGENDKSNHQNGNIQFHRALDR